MIGQSCRHRGRTGPPHRGGAPAIGGNGLRQRLAYTGMGQDEVVVDLEQDQVLASPVCPLTRRGAASSQRRVVYLPNADKYRGRHLSTVTGAKRPGREDSHGIPAALSPLVTPSQPAVRTHRPRVSSRHPVAPSPTLSSSHLRWLRPGWHPIRQHFSQGPHMVSQPRGHRRCTGPPVLCGARTVGGQGLGQELA